MIGSFFMAIFMRAPPKFCLRGHSNIAQYKRRGVPILGTHFEMYHTVSQGPPLRKKKSYAILEHQINHFMVRNKITDLKTTTYTFKHRRRHILFNTEDDVQSQPSMNLILFYIFLLHMFCNYMTARNGG